MEINILLNNAIPPPKKKGGWPIVNAPKVKSMQKHNLQEEKKQKHFLLCQKNNKLSHITTHFSCNEN